MSDELKASLERARDHVISQEEAQKQRVSFVYGNMPRESEATPEEVERRLSGTQRAG
ncbi:MAG: hypothetical protein ACT4OF_12550 [Caulobacteraceae bacterium]